MSRAIRKRERPPAIKGSMQFAIDNVARFGDTDIFPFPIERQLIRDCPDDILRILLNIYKNFDDSIQTMHIESEGLLQAVGYTGFRQGTQIDPIWNLYLLGLVIEIGNDIEKARVDKEREVVFSYRFLPDNKDKTLFSREEGWVAFQKRAVELSSKHGYVLTCDISDFYPRIYHHRLENALKKSTTNTQAIEHTKKILATLSRGVSYGLPVGGPAARLLSELLLNRVDRLLLTRGVDFCRFVDDYYIFADSKEDVYSHLIYLCETLLENEGLTLQKSKSRILSSAEFLETSPFTDTGRILEPKEIVERDFLTLHIHFDPYSDTADEDYETLKTELMKFDIVGMLSAEMHKTRISLGITKKLVRAIKHLKTTTRSLAIRSLMENLPTLYPIFPTVMMVIRDILDELDDDVREIVFQQLRELITSGSYICAVHVNLAFALRVLASDNSEETDAMLIRLYSSIHSSLIRRDIILILASHNADYWISSMLKRYSNCTLWEKRALLIASYILEDEGGHWRKRIPKLSPFDSLLIQWAAECKNTGKPITLR